MKNTNSPTLHLKSYASDKLCLTVTPSNRFDTSIYKAQKNFNKSASFGFLAGVAAQKRTISNAHNMKIIGDESSDVPSILSIESELEEHKQIPKDGCGSEVEGGMERCLTAVSKSAGIDHVKKTLRILSNQLNIQNNNCVKSSSKRNYPMELQKIEIDTSLKSLSALDNYVCTLFSSMCIIKRIDSMAKDLLPINIISLKRPQGLLCNFCYNSTANKTLVLDLDETLVHQDTKGEITISIPLDQKVYTEVIVWMRRIGVNRSPTRS